MSFKPFLDSLATAVGEEVDDIASFQVHDDGAVALPIEPGPVVDPHEPRRRDRVILELPDAPEEFIGAGRHGEPRSEAGDGLAAQGATNPLVGLPEQGGSASARVANTGSRSAKMLRRHSGCGYEKERTAT